MKPYAMIRTVINISSGWLFMLAAVIEYAGTSFWLLSFCFLLK